MRRFFLASAFVVMSASVSPAAVRTLTAGLSGANERPNPNASPATGFATATLNDVTGAFSVSGTYSGLLGINPFGHIHAFAGPSGTAGVKFNLAVSGFPDGAFSGSTTFTAAEIPQVLAGLTYVNIHTNDPDGAGPGVGFGGGEIRGNLVVPEPTSLAAIAGAAMLVSRRRRA